MIITESVQNFIKQPNDYTLIVGSSNELMAVNRKTMGVAVPLLTSKEQFLTLNSLTDDPTVDRLISVIHRSHYLDERFRSLGALSVNFHTLTPFENPAKKQEYFLQLAKWAEEKIGEPEYAARCEFAKRVTLYALSYYDPAKADILFEDLELSEFPECFIKNCVDVLCLKPTELQPIIAQLPKSVKDSPNLMRAIESEFIKKETNFSGLKEKWIESFPEHEAWIEIIVQKIAKSKIEKTALDLTEFPKEVIASAPFDLIFGANPLLRSYDQLVLPVELMEDKSFMLPLIKSGFLLDSLAFSLISNEEFLRELAAFSTSKLIDFVSLAINQSSVLKIILESSPDKIFEAMNSPHFSELGARALIDLNPMFLFILPQNHITDERKSQAYEQFKKGIDGLVTESTLALYKNQVKYFADSERHFEKLEEDSEKGRLARFKYLSQVSGLSGELEGKKLEGWYPGVSLSLIERMVDLEMPDLKDRDLILNAVKMAKSFDFDHEKLSVEYADDKPILIPLGYMRSDGKSGHSVSVVLWKEHMIIANRGDRHPTHLPFTYFKIDPAKVTKEYLEILSTSLIAENVEAQTAALYEIIPGLVYDSSSSPEEKIAIESALTAKDQTVGNCSCASMKAGFHALAFISELKRGSKLHEAVHQSKLQSDKLSIKLRAQAEALTYGDLAKFIDPKDKFTATILYFRSKCKSFKKQLKLADSDAEFAKILDEMNAIIVDLKSTIPLYARFPDFIKLQLSLYQHPSCSDAQKKLTEASFAENLNMIKESLPTEMVINIANDRDDLKPVLQTKLNSMQSFDNTIRAAVGLEPLLVQLVSLAD